LAAFSAAQEGELVFFTEMSQKEIKMEKYSLLLLKNGV